MSTIKSVENFKKENKLTDEVIQHLKRCYENPWNEYKHLSFVDYLYELKAAEGGQIFSEILATIVD